MDTHAVLGTRFVPPFPEGIEAIQLGLGCFWGAERIFWKLPGVHATAVGYAGGHTAEASYKEVCSGRTGHAEVVLVAWDPALTGLDAILRAFWEGHDPTQGNRQGNDRGTQYRSAIYWTTEEQKATVVASRDSYQAALAAAHRGAITTELAPASPMIYAESYHQQYLQKNPGGYCGIAGTGVACPIGLAV